MKSPAPAAWEQQFDEWLEPFLEVLGHRARRRWAPRYLRGLLSASERKSLQPLAEEVAPGDYDQLHHFVSDSDWDTAPLERLLAVKAQAMLGGPTAFLIIDDTTLLKQGRHSVGVARQYSGAAGKTTNCQALVSLTLAQGEVPLPLALRLYLPEEWTGDEARCRRAGVPAERMCYRKKTEIALEEIDQVLESGVTFGSVLADAGYGTSAGFRQALSSRGLRWCVGISRIQKVYDPAVALTWPPAAPQGGRPRKHPVASVEAASAEDVLAALPEAAWQEISWRRGTKGPLRARFAAVRVRVADGPTESRNRHLPGEEVWLLGEHRSTGEKKYYLSNDGAETPLTVLAAAIKARWSCEQAHQQMKEELGLDHFEGRRWRGLHHHALLTMIAFAFLQHLRLVEAQREKNRAAAGAGRAAEADASTSAPAAPPSTHAGGTPTLPRLSAPLPT